MPQIVTIFGDKAFNRGDRVKMESLGWVLLQLAGILIRRGDDIRGEVAWRGHHVKKQQETGHL